MTDPAYGGGKRSAPKPKKAKRPGRLTGRQKLLIAAAAVLAVALLAVLAWKSVFVRPDIHAGETGGTEDPTTGEPAEEIDWGEGIRPVSGGERKSEDYYTVLILGRDTGGGGNTDTMLLASYDVTNQKATVMSIPRDTMVNVSWDIKKINSVYNAYGGGDKGIQALYKEISQLVGFEPDFQVIVEWEAVGEIVDAMDGVWFDVPRDMDYEDPYQDLVIHQKAGYRLLSGDDAMQVLRFRDGVNGYKTGDLGRIGTQQAFLKAMVEQLLKIENIPKINEFVEVFKSCVETDLTLRNILWFAKAAITGGLKAEDVEFITMPNTPKYAYSAETSRLNGYYSEQSYVVPNANELLELVNTKLSPYKEVFTRSDLDIMSINADGSVSSSTGHLEDPSAANPRSYWQAQWAPEEETPEVDENGDPAVTDPETGEAVTPGGGTADPGGETADPGTGETTVPGGWPLDPVTGEPLPPEMVDPGTGGADPDPGTGETPDAGGQTGGDGQNAPPSSGQGETTDSGSQAPDDGFVIMN